MTLSFKYILSFLLFVGLITSCHDDFEIPGPTEETRQDPIVELIESNINGIVFDEKNRPVSNAEVILEGTITYTNDYGYFDFKNIIAKSTGSLLSISKEEYIKNFKVVYPDNINDVNYSIRLNKRQLIATHDSNFEGTYVIDGGASIQLPANGIKDQENNIYNGQVMIFASWIDAESSDIFNDMPGNLSGINKEGDQVQLASYGMMYVELEDASGNLLNIADGFESTITLPLSSTQLSSADNQIPLWYFDEDKGQWIEDGFAEKIGNEYVGNVSHFTFWNCDAPYDLVQIEGRLVNLFNIPLANFPLTFHLNSGTVSATGYTNEDGIFKGKVPKDAFLKLVINQCDQVDFELTIDPLNMDTDLEDIIVTFFSSQSTISGNVIGCLGDDNSLMYAIIEQGGDGPTLICQMQDDGTFSKSFVPCSTSGITMRFFNPNDASVSEIYDINFISNEAVIENVELCNVQSDLGSISINNNNVNEVGLVTRGGMYKLLNENKLVYRDWVFVNGFANQLFLTMNSFEVRKYDKDEFYFEFNYNGSSFATDASNSNFEFEVLSVGDKGDYFIAEYKNLEDRSNLKDPISGTIRFKIVDAFNTGKIKGRVWVDEDSDGIQDITETQFHDGFRMIAREADQPMGTLPFAAGSEVNDDGTYTIVGLYPNRNYVIEDSNGITNEVTLIDQGSDDTIDNDFYRIGFNQGVITFEYYLDDGMTIENIDLGFMSN